MQLTFSTEDLERLAQAELLRLGFELKPGSQPFFDGQSKSLVMPIVACNHNGLPLANVEEVTAVPPSSLSIPAAEIPAKIGAVTSTGKSSSKRGTGAKVGSGNGAGADKKDSTRRAYTRTTVVDVEADQTRLRELEVAGITKLAGQAHSKVSDLPQSHQELVREVWRIQGRLGRRKGNVSGLTAAATIEAPIADVINVAAVPSFAATNTLSNNESFAIGTAEGQNSHLDTTVSINDSSAQGTTSLEELEQLSQTVQGAQEQEEAEVVAATADPFFQRLNPNTEQQARTAQAFSL